MVALDPWGRGVRGDAIEFGPNPLLSHDAAFVETEPHCEIAYFASWLLRDPRRARYACLGNLLRVAGSKVTTVYAIAKLRVSHAHFSFM